MEVAVATEARTEIAPAVLERARGGDGAAFAALVRHYDSGLRALAYRLLGERGLMDDALQEAYVKAFRGLRRFRGESSAGTWLYRITYNACLDQLRRSKRHRAASLDAVAESPDPRPGADHLAEQRDLLARGLEALTPEQRAAVVMVDAHGFDYSAAAEVLGIPAGTVGSRLSTARAALRRALEPEEEEQHG